MSETTPAETAKRALVWALVVIGLVLLLLLAWQLRQFLVLVFFALLIAASVYTLESWLEKRGVPRLVALLMVYLAVLAVLAGIVWIIVPPLIGQLVELAQNLPSYVARARDVVQSIFAHLPGDLGDTGLNGITDHLSALIPSAGALATVPLVVFGVVVNLVLITFLSALLVLERDSLRDAMLAYVRPDHRERVRDVGAAAMDKLGAYVRGQLIMMAAIGIVTGVGMLLIGVPFVLPLAFLAFLTEAIPLIGPFIAGIPITAIAFADGGLVAGVLMAVWIIGLQQLEGYVLQPIVQRRAVALSPVVVLLSVVAGGALAGIVGALVAVPVVAVAQVILGQVVLPLRRHSWEDR